jgi:hypothetical protein
MKFGMYEPDSFQDMGSLVGMPLAKLRSIGVVKRVTNMGLRGRFKE